MESETLSRAFSEDRLLRRKKKDRCSSYILLYKFKNLKIDNDKMRY